MPNQFSFNTSIWNSFIFGDMWDSIVQGTFARAWDPNQFYTFLTVNVPDAIGDGIIYKLWSDKGSKTLCWMGTYGPNSGIISWYIDGVFIADQDLYRGAQQKGREESWPITVLTNGDHEIKLVCNAKNPLSGHYYHSITWIRIK